MKMKKILAALVLSLAVSVTAFAKEEVWQYNQFTTIDMSSAKISYPAGMQTLTFHTVEKAGDSTDYCTYVYNVDEQTIQLKEMVTKTKKSKYKSSFYPESIKNGNNVIKARARMADEVLQKVLEKLNK
ncbi:hypothetical protein AT798_07930 [Megasphaera sp. DJF_B143]|uniref:Uncharacterized protein n=2 Tax=Megasphaera hexanoica TaxID=1675036 RepID=A0A848BRU5_9FIRM|nr:hypothetical protein ACT01_09280 [Megasphaera hexanoica]KUH55402.1 hypothetical protein AT798_07930 [Megasphaera sp. DJF_B143]NME27985.1 hypothetical protein [Megasphaera hexanoica]